MLHYPNHGFATSNLAAYVIFRRDNKVAFVRRSNTGWMDGYFGLPSGRVDDNESFAQAAAREAQEEVGVTVAQQDLLPLLTWQRHYSDGDWVDMIFEANKWSGELVNAEPDKHSELVWLDVHDLPQNTIPEIKFAFEQIAAGKIYAEFGWN